MRPPMKKVDFNVEDKVEVASNEEGFFGSYYQATMMSCLENGQYLVQYKNLLEHNESKVLTETRFPKELRPLPPRVCIPEFDYYQMVDAFDNDGWWFSKIVMKLPAKKKGSWKYKVYFHIFDEELWYPANKVRIHHEWVGGEWIISS